MFYTRRPVRVRNNGRELLIGYIDHPAIGEWWFTPTPNAWTEGKPFRICEY